MKNFGLAAFAAAIVASAPAAGEVLNFDDLSGTNFFTSDYKGFRFGDNSQATNPWFYTNDVTSNYRANSGKTYVATDFNLYNSSNPYQGTQPISRSTSFIFDGAFFSGTNAVGYQLYLDNSLVYTSTPSAALTATPRFVASGYTGAVNSVVVFGQQGYYALDDFTYRAVGSISPAVPEPATWAMMLVGFGMVGGAVRYRRQKTAKTFA